MMHNLDIKDKVRKFTCVAVASRGSIVVIATAIMMCACSCSGQMPDLYEQAQAVLDEKADAGADEALALLDRAIEQDMRLQESCRTAADICISLYRLDPSANAARLDQALAYAEKLKTALPEAADGYAAEGMVLMHKGDTEKGAASLKKALEIDPGNADAGLSYLVWLTGTGNEAGINAFVLDVSGHVKDDAALCSSYAGVFLKAGRWRTAAEFYHMAREAGGGNDPDVLSGAAEALMHMDRFIDAAGFYAAAYQAAPEDLSLLARASVAFAKGGDITNAARFAEFYTMKNPNDMTALKYLAGYYDKLDRKQEADRIRNVVDSMKKNQR